MTKPKPPRKPQQPKASRPFMPGYGVLAVDRGKGLLPWSWAAARLSESHNYWIATTRPDRRPHAVAVWGVWFEGSFYFSTGRNSRKARNLSANPSCVVCTARADEAVIVEGIAEEISKAARLRRVGRVYKKKYRWDLDPGLGPIFAVRPQVAFGFIEKADDFCRTATRWVFKED